ncbi:MAG TPA: hypothetical protein VF156_13625, partial [Agromyces sp.]
MPASPLSARNPRRMAPARAALASLACALLLGTVACSSPEGDEPPASSERPAASASETPIFASDEEALAAAVEAYKAYSDMSALISAEGGVDPDRIRPFVSDAIAPTYIEEFESIAKAKIRSRGEARIYGARLAERSGNEISAYLCRDYSNVRILDAKGTDITSPSRPSVSASLARFAPAEDDA